MSPTRSAATEFRGSIRMTSERPLLIDDDRALAFNIVVFFATIVLGFLLAMVVQGPGEQLLEFAALHTTSEAAADGQDYVGFAWQSAHIIVIAFGVVQLVTAAVVEARAP